MLVLQAKFEGEFEKWQAIRASAGGMLVGHTC